MTALPLILSLALPLQAGDRSAPQLDARAERGIGGIQSEGWQHIALRLTNPPEKPIAGRATLYEWESQTGARPRVVLPFTVTDRQVLHFYPFRPPESPQPTSFVITLEDNDGRPIAHDGGTQIVIGGQSVRAVRVDMGNASSSDDFRVGVWGESAPYLRTIISSWTPNTQELFRQERGPRSQMFNRGGRGISPEAIGLEQPKNFPDSFLGYGPLEVVVAYGVDPERELTERQRRALTDWIHGGGLFVYVPRVAAQLASSFWHDLAGIRLKDEVTSPDDSHLSRYLVPNSGAPQGIVHFLTTVDSGKARESTVSLDGEPVVYSVPAGNGRVWIVGFDPDSHGGAARYQPLWLEILNQTLRYHVRDGNPPTSVAAHAWSPESDREWLAALSGRFGKLPTLEMLAILILGYLLVIGPVNYFVLKRREARIWLIATVPALAFVFGAVVLAMGYVSHGMRSATSQMALAVVSPEGGRAYVEEFVGVYGTTSAEYRLGFPRNLPVRPLGEFAANPNGGFEGPASFKLALREDRTWLEDWRLTFWQTRGTASIDCVLLDGQLTASRRGREITVNNQTTIPFESVSLIGAIRHTIGPIGPFRAEQFVLPEGAADWIKDDETPLSAAIDRKMGSLLSTSAAAPRSDSTPKPAVAESPKPNDDPNPDADFESLQGPEAARLLSMAANRLRDGSRLWVVGLTRQPIHKIESPDAKKSYSVTLYAWPVAEPRGENTSRD